MSRWNVGIVIGTGLQHAKPGLLVPPPSAPTWFPAVTHGQQINPQVTGPWVPQRVVQGAEVYDTIAVPSRGYYRFDNPEDFVPQQPWPTNADDAHPEILNDPNLHGGVVTTPVVIDGYLIPAGTNIVQYRRFTAGFGATGNLTVLLRGCQLRWDGDIGDAGAYNPSSLVSASQQLWFHWCDLGNPSPMIPVGKDAFFIKTPFGGGHRMFRCHYTNTNSAWLPYTESCEFVENYINDLMYWYGEGGTVPGNSSSVHHINGIKYEVAVQKARILRNWVTAPSPDRDDGSTGSALGQPGYGTQPGQVGYGAGSNPGRVLGQTDCIALLAHGTQWGSLDVQIRDNYMGGTGYSLYLDSSAGPMRNVKVTGNKFTTQWWTQGGQFGVVNIGTNGTPPIDGINGCQWYGNVWADDYGSGGDGCTALADRQYPSGNGPRVGRSVL